MQLKWEKKLHRIVGIATAIFIICAVIGAIWCLSLFLFNTDTLGTTGLHFFASGSSHVVLQLFRSNALTTGFWALGIFIALLALFIAIIMVVGKKRCSQTILPERRGALQILRIFTGFALLAIPVIYTVFTLNGFEVGKFQGTANFVAMIMAIPASLYFLFPGIADRFSEFLQTLFGICFIVFAILSAVVTHSYMFEGLTSPVRTLNLLSLLAMMLFMLYEIRFYAAKPIASMYLASAGLAIFFCGINGLPRLILTAIGEMKVSVQTMYACLEITVALYAACRVLLFLSEWRYTLQNAALNEDDVLPDTVSLKDPEINDETVEPDYTKDSEIESSINEGQIDLDMYDLAFDGMNVSETDALDALTAPTPLAEELTEDRMDPLDAMMDETVAEACDDLSQNDPLDLFTAMMSEMESTPDAVTMEEESEENEKEADLVEDKLDALSDLLFGENTESEEP